MSGLGVQYDRARITGELEYRRPFGGVGGTGVRGKVACDLAVEFSSAQDDPLLLALIARINEKAQQDAIKYYANHISALGDF